MKMVTLLAGKQLQKDSAKKKPSTINSVKEESSDLEDETGELRLFGQSVGWSIDQTVGQLGWSDRQTDRQLIS